MIMPSAIATTSVASELRSPMRLARNVPHPDATISAATTAAVVGRGRLMLGWLEDAGLLLLVALVFPLVILVAGAPLAFFVRLLLEIARRWS